MVRMRHPNICTFMGLTVTPPALITGGRPRPACRVASGGHLQRLPHCDAVTQHDTLCFNTSNVCLPTCFATVTAPQTELPPAAEYCARGSLYDQLRAASRQPEAAAQLTWHRRLGMALDAAMGLCYLHSRKPPIIHRGELGGCWRAWAVGW